MKLDAPREGLEAILRPDKPGVVHRTGLVPNHSTFCECSVKGLWKVTPLCVTRHLCELCVTNSYFRM